MIIACYNMQIKYDIITLKIPEQYGTLVWVLDQSGYRKQYYTGYHKQSHIPPEN